jgi:hypothetical protein
MQDGWDRNRADHERERGVIVVRRATHGYHATLTADSRPIAAEVERTTKDQAKGGAESSR